MTVLVLRVTLVHKKAKIMQWSLLVISGDSYNIFSTPGEGVGAQRFVTKLIFICVRVTKTWPVSWVKMSYQNEDVACQTYEYYLKQASGSSERCWVCRFSHMVSEFAISWIISFLVTLVFDNETSNIKFHSIRPSKRYLREIKSDTWSRNNKKNLECILISISSKRGLTQFRELFTAIPFLALAKF